MTGVPVDATYAWVAVSLASAAALALAAQTPAASIDAESAARTVDAVDASPYPSRATHPLGADGVRVGARRLALRRDGRTARATFTYGPVTPVGGEGDLLRVLRGEPPSHVFDAPTAFRRALSQARNRTPRWRPAGGELLVRRVTWEDVDATLVGA